MKYTYIIKYIFDIWVGCGVEGEMAKAGEHDILVQLRRRGWENFRTQKKTYIDVNLSTSFLCFP